MFEGFLYALRRHGVPVATQEWLVLQRALSLGLHESSLDGLHGVARALLVKDLGRYDAFDAAFLECFKGALAEGKTIREELRRWLDDPRRLATLSDEARALLESLTRDQLEQLLADRLREQQERHDGGSKWVGTGGTSPFGNSGSHPSGLRIGPGGGRQAMHVAEERRFREVRRDAVLDVRVIDVALRLLRELGRDGAEEELDLDESIARTAKNAGELEVVLRPPRRNRVKVVLLMDVGGSMDPHSHLASRLFTAASRAGRFARFRAYYFHNCVYEAVYADAHFHEPLSVADLLAGTDRDEKLVIVGDAAMHPSELLEPGGSLYFHTRNRTPGLAWMRLIRAHFRRAAWLNPEPERLWTGQTARVLSTLFPMHPLTLAGLEGAVRGLVRGVR